MKLISLILSSLFPLAPLPLPPLKKMLVPFVANLIKKKITQCINRYGIKKYI